MVAQIGDSVSLTCTTTGCESPSFSWRTQIDSPLNGKVKTEGSKSILTMDPVSFENEHAYLCTATCGSGKLERGIQVDVYCKCRKEVFFFLKKSSNDMCSRDFLRVSRFLARWFQ